ncbi:MAG: thiamine/thiamine pyrophosphate ABC transporter permease ThiP [Paracoccaceae bacterium]
MAQRPVSIVLRLTSGAAALLVVVLTLGTLAAVGWRAVPRGGLSAADLSAIRFTVWQALLSAVFSIALAIPTARALSRRRFPGRGILVTLLGAPFLLPVIVAVLGLLAVFGRGGILNTALGQFGVDPVSIYGIWGIVLAHVFFNLPLATRLILQGWVEIPAERFRLAATLNAPVFLLLEWPMLRRVVPGIFLVVFLICLTSFAVALTLGGGPSATTVELAIYQAVRFDFDLGRAALLSCVQFALCTIAAVLAFRVTLTEGFGAGLDRVVPRWDGRVWIDAVVLVLVTLFLLLPLTMILLRGLPALLTLPSQVWPAAWRSIWVASLATGLTVLLALAMALRGGRFMQGVGVLPLAASPLVVGTGLFVMIYPFASPPQFALAVTIVVNAALALPFALRALAPAVATVESDYGRLADQLNLTGWSRLRLVILPRIRRPLGFAAGLAAALSMGDLGVIALFATEDQATLPLVMYRLMGSYRMDAAAGVALLLVALSLGAFWVCDRGGRMNADA